VVVRAAVVVRAEAANEAAAAARAAVGARKKRPDRRRHRGGRSLPSSASEDGRQYGCGRAAEAAAEAVSVGRARARASHTPLRPPSPTSSLCYSASLVKMYVG